CSYFLNFNMRKTCGQGIKSSAQNDISTSCTGRLGTPVAKDGGFAGVRKPLFTHLPLTGSKLGMACLAPKSGQPAPRTRLGLASIHPFFPRRGREESFLPHTGGCRGGNPSCGAFIRPKKENSA